MNRACSCEGASYDITCEPHGVRALFRARQIGLPPGKLCKCCLIGGDGHGLRVEIPSRNCEIHRLPEEA